MGLPVFGASNSTTPHWQEDPNERGTWDLLQSCLVTLALCVYTSIHINVFNSEVGTWSRFWIRVKWALIALLIPELIVFNAWVQRRLAHRIAKVLRARSGQEEPPCIIVRFKRWLVKKLKKRFRNGAKQSQVSWGRRVRMSKEGRALKSMLTLSPHLKTLTANPC